MQGGVETIVSFESPPVVEVVAGVALAGASADASVLLGAFWKDRLRDEFPNVQSQPPYAPPIETFGPGPRGSSLTFDLQFGVVAPRLWALSADGQNLLQLQPEYFACNWRKVQPKDQYDRWFKRRDAFGRWLDTLFGYFDSTATARPNITQCEVTYINHIVAGGSWGDHADFADVFRVSLPPLVHQLEQVAAQAQFVLDDGRGPWGRLHVKIVPGYARDGMTPLFVLELTARGAPIDDSVAGAIEFLDRARAEIDHAFVAVTTEAMHREWGIQK